MDGCHLVIHERCQWDPGSEEKWDILKASCVQVQSKDLLFFFSRSRDTFVWLTLCVCAFWKIGNKRNRLCLCWFNSSLEIRSFFFISFTGDCIIMMKIQINCVHMRWKVQQYYKSGTSSSAFFVFCDWMIGGSPDASWSPSWVWIWISFFFYIRSHVKQGG